MQGVSIISHPNGQPAVLTIHLDSLPAEVSPLVTALLNQIQADERTALPYEFAPTFEQERREFLEASMINLNRAYGEDEVEYTIDDCKWVNPNFKPLGDPAI